MNVALPHYVETRFSPEDLALPMALGLYVCKKITLGQAAEIAGLTQQQFQHELGDRDIPINYSLDNWKADLAVIRELAK